MDSESESSTLEMGLPENDGPVLWEFSEDHPVDVDGRPYMTASFRLFMARAELLSFIFSWEDYREATASLNRHLFREATATATASLNHHLFMWHMTRGMILKRATFQVWLLLNGPCAAALSAAAQPGTTTKLDSCGKPWDAGSEGGRVEV